MHVKRTIPACKPENQAAWTIFILGIVFNNLTPGRQGLFHFSYSDCPQYYLIDRVFRKFILT